MCIGLKCESLIIMCPGCVFNIYVCVCVCVSECACHPNKNVSL